MKLSVLLFVLSCLLSNSATITDLKSPLWGPLEPGEFEVGFQTLWFVDESRTYQEDDILEIGSTGRPFRLMTWYPAMGDEEKPFLTFADYLSLESANPKYKKWAQTMRQKDKITARKQFNQENTRDSLLAVIEKLPTMAKTNLSFEDGKFPLVIHLLGLNDYQEESTTLWEYLASNGYVVLVIPQIGKDASSINTQFSAEIVEIASQDIKASLDFLRSSEIRSHIDFEKIGLIGHSLGGAVALHYAHENKVTSIALLDGAIYDDASKEVLKTFNFDPTKFRSEILNLYPSYHEQVTSLPLFNSLSHVNQYHVSFPKATHFDFQQWPLYAYLTGVDDPRAANYRSTEDGYYDYFAVCRLTRSYFDGTLKEQREAMDVLKGGKRLDYQDKCELTFFFREN